VLDDKKLALARSLHKDNTPPAVICATLGISRTSLYRYLAMPTSPATSSREVASSTPSRRAASSTPSKARG
jgi:hypothetical protein